MKILTFGEIMDGGATVFSSVARLDGDKLTLSFQGVIRIDNPYRYLASYLEELKRLLPQQSPQRTILDFTELQFCNSNGFYIIMDMVELAYRSLSGAVVVRRLADDDWQQETLPILLNTDEDEIAQRTSFENVAAMD